MTTTKSTVEQIRERFDHEVERFSNIQTGQAATMDAPLAMELVTDAAAAITSQATAILDIGCGAGNYTIKMLQKLPGLESTLIDLSRPMLDRAVERITAAGAKSVNALRGDIRQLPLAAGSVDIVLAAAVMHHMRTDAEWESVFGKIFSALRPGGSFWIFDLIEQDLPAIQNIMWARYGEYLSDLKDENYRDHVFEYVQTEDTPRSLTYQLGIMNKVGFARVEILHKHGPFAAFGAAK